MQKINLNLRGKLLVIVLIGLIIGFSVVASFRIHRDKIKISEDINRSGNERVTLMAESLASLLVASDYSNLQSLAERFTTLQDVKQINILDSDGAVLLRRNSSDFNPDMEGSVFEAPIISAGKTIGSVQLFVSLDRLHEAVNDIYRVVAIALIFTTLFFGVVIYAVVSVLIVRPLVRLSEAADQLALGDYSAVLPPVTKDELGKLVHAFSSMRESRRLSEAKLSAIFYNSPDAFIQLDCNGNIVNWNDKAEIIFGYNKSEVIGKNFSMIMPAEELGLNRGYRKCYQKSENIIGVIREIVGRRSDGSHFPLELRTSQINFEGEHAYIVSARDISERKESEAKLLNAMNAAGAANAAKNAFISNISHEIRTPMNSIIGMTNLALKTPLDPKQYDYLTKIDYAAHHLLALINNILDFSKIEANKLELEIRDFELHSVFENLSSQLAYSATSKGLLLNFLPDSCLSMPLRGDPLRLTQILLNYTSNAIKFTDKGEITVHASILEESKSHLLLRFEVQDTGIGISVEAIDKLFKAFHQADASTSRKYGGTGLGLAISKQLAELMGGTLGVESQPNQGSKFWFTARLAQGSEPVAHATPPRPLNMEVLKGAAILLAEDNPFNQQVAFEILRDAGARVSIVSNGQEAIDMLQTRRFDCVLMDMQMPVMDGLEAARQIRSNPALADIPVIAMTANAGHEDRSRCFAAGMDYFVSKPVFPDQLYAAVAQCVASVRTGNAVAEVLQGSAGQDAAPQPAINDDSVVIDLSVLEKVIGSDPVKLRNFALRYLQLAQLGLDEIEVALRQENMLALGTLGHRYKTPARTVGAQGFADLCQALEKSADIGQARHIVAQMRPLQEQISEYIHGVTGMSN